MSSSSEKKKVTDKDAENFVLIQVFPSDGMVLHMGRNARPSKRGLFGNNGHHSRWDEIAQFHVRVLVKSVPLTRSFVILAAVCVVRFPAGPRRRDKITRR